MSAPIQITVTPRAHDWHAHVGDDRRLWAAGRTADEAIGSLLRTHPEACGIVIVDVPGPTPDTGASWRRGLTLATRPEIDAVVPPKVKP